jgi:hypothetical protein
MNRTGKNTAKHNPRKGSRTEQRAKKKKKNRTGSGNVYKLEKQAFPF